MSEPRCRHKRTGQPNGFCGTCTQLLQRQVERPQQSLVFAESFIELVDAYAYDVAKAKHDSKMQNDKRYRERFLAEVKVRQ